MKLRSDSYSRRASILIWPRNIPDQHSNQSPSWMEAAGMWMPSGQMASLSMLTILGLILRRASGLPRSRKRGFKNIQYLSNQNEHLHRENVEPSCWTKLRREKHGQRSNPRLRRAGQRQDEGSRGQSDR